MTNAGEFRDDLKRVMERAERWVRSLESEPDIPGDSATRGDDVEALHGLRTRATSSLINVTVLGAFSSGKSFLISGIQGGLEYLQISDGDGGYADKYIGILPSASTTTTARPSTVVPVGADASANAGGRGFLRVRFIDSAESEWADIGTDLPPAVVAAYGAEDGDVADRRREHRSLDVAEIEILISDPELPAKFYDLPGAGSLNATHDLIMKAAWLEADCFIYVTQATSVLSAAELELIRELYAHHLSTGKRVIWVLTAIDRAAQLGTDNKPAWQATRDRNNAYLHEHFRVPEGRPDTFIGEGFIPVSPALEAKAAFELANDEIRAANRLRDSSKMKGLRQRLATMIEEGTGQQHLAQIANEARLIVRRRQRPISDALTTHRLPVEELVKQRADIQQRLDQTNNSGDQDRTRLAADLDRRIRIAERPFGSLKHALHDGLDDLIRGGDLKEKHANAIDVRYEEIFQDWMTGTNGPATIWQQQLEAFKGEAQSLLRLGLGEDESTQLVSPDPLDIDLLRGSTVRRRPLGAYELVRTAAATAGLVSPIAGGVTWLMTSLAFATVAAPVGAALGAAAVVSVTAKALRDRDSAIDRARTERIEKLDDEADIAKSRFNLIAHQMGQLIIDAVAGHLADHRERLEATLLEIRERISAPDIVKSQALVTHLGPFEREAEEIISDLRHFQLAQ